MILSRVLLALSVLGLIISVVLFFAVVSDVIWKLICQ